MTTLLSLAALLVLVLATAHRQPWRLPLPAGVRMLLVTRSDFLLIGALLGPFFLGVVDTTTIEILRPFSSLALGFIGLHYGLQLDAQRLRKVPPFYKLGPWVQAAGGAVAVGIPAWFFFREVFGTGREPVVAALVLAAAAACSTGIPLEMLAREEKYRASPLLMMLRHLAEMGELLALVIFGLALCYRHENPVIIGWDAFITLQWIGFSLLLGALFGGVLLLLPRVGRSGGRMMVTGIGALLFFTGSASFLLLSPLFVSLIAGIIVANVPSESRHIARFATRAEPSFVLFLLIVAGAVWQLNAGSGFGIWEIVALAFVLMMLRLIGKTAAGWILAKTTHAAREPPRRFGLGLVAQGSISAALALDYLQSGSTPETRVVVTVVLLAVLATELISPWLILHVLERKPRGTSAPKAGPAESSS